MKDLENSFFWNTVEYKENKDTKLNHVKLPKGFNTTDAGLQKDSSFLTAK